MHNLKLKKMYNSRKKGFIESPNKKIVLTYAQLFRTLGSLRIPEYKPREVHIKDLSIAIAREAVKTKH